MRRDPVGRSLDAAHYVSPFLVLGDPTPTLSLELAKAAVSAGAGMLEIGFPYGDPVADGPAVQGACERALAAGTSTARAMTILRDIHDACPNTPLNLLVYGNLVHRMGFDRFCEEARAAGASTLLVPDICLEESAPLKKACRRAGLGHVHLVGPLTAPERLKRIDAAATSFIYLVARQGVTGVRAGMFDDVEALVARTAASLRLPLCVGFGLSTADQISRVFASGAKLAVVGSYLANIIGKNVSEGEDALLRRFSEAVSELTAAR